MDEGKRREEVDRGARAAALLRDELLIEAFDKLETEYISAWRETEEAQSDRREKIFLMLKSLQGVRAHLESVAMTGDLARRELDRGIKG